MTNSERPLVNDAFDLLAKNTELSLGEYTAITQSQADIERYLQQHLGTFSTVLYGAFSRKTIVSPLPGSIIDMLVLFRGDDVKRRYPSRTFTVLSDALMKKFPAAYVLEGKNVLMLPSHDFIFKIHPAYPLSDACYMLPDENFNDWTKYDISTYNKIFVSENVRHKGILIEIIRMIKTWNRASGNLFNGYYLELLVTDILLTYQITSYAETLRYIFGRAVSEVVFQKHDPANMEIQIEGLNDIDDLIKAMILLKKSYLLAKEAVLLEQENKTDEALINWNKIFPDVFPTSIGMRIGKARNTGMKGADALRMLIEQK